MHIHTGGLRVPTEYHKDGITYSPFTDDSQMQQVQQKMDSDLSEPYSIFTYRYFVHNWPTLTWLVCCHTHPCARRPTARDGLIVCV